MGINTWRRGERDLSTRGMPVLAGDSGDAGGTGTRWRGGGCEGPERSAPWLPACTAAGDGGAGAWGERNRLRLVWPLLCSTGGGDDDVGASDRSSTLCRVPSGSTSATFEEFDRTTSSELGRASSAKKAAS